MVTVDCLAAAPTNTGSFGLEKGLGIGRSLGFGQVWGGIVVGIVVVDMAAKI